MGINKNRKQLEALSMYNSIVIVRGREYIEIKPLLSERVRHFSARVRFIPSQDFSDISRRGKDKASFLHFNG